MVAISAIGIYAVLLLLTRLAGLRSFSKMSSFDFAITVAFGAVVASTMLAKDPPLLVGAFGLVVLYGVQYAVSKARRANALIERLVDNVPLLLMAGEQVLSDHLDFARMTEEDLKAKLRMAGVTSPSQVVAVIFETTGDVSVLTKSDEITPWVFEGVRGVERLSFVSDAA